jgi:hypothetical protein
MYRQLQPKLLDSNCETQRRAHRASYSEAIWRQHRGEIVLAPQKKYVLADLIARCDPKAPPPADLALWSLPLRKAVISHATPALLSA